MKFEKATLDNGLNIVAECNAGAYSTALGFFVNTGRGMRATRFRASVIFWNT